MPDIPLERKVLIIWLMLAIFFVANWMSPKTNQVHQHHENEKFKPTQKINAVPSNSSSDHSKHAVIHMGPDKTGTSTIQYFARKGRKLLELDGYFMVEQCHSFAACFTPHSGECDHVMLLDGLDIAHRNENLFMSAEKFSRINDDNISLLQAYLSAWDKVTIIIYYRRYFDWLVSDYNQHAKNRVWQGPEKIWNYSILDYLNDRLTKSKRYGDNYVLDLYLRLTQKFDDVVVMNFHNHKVSGTAESFYCQALPHAFHMCDAVRSENSKNITRKNAGTNLDFVDLAYGAKMAGLVAFETDEEMHTVAREMERFHAEYSDGRDLIRTCPSNDILDAVWNISLKAEELFFPEQINRTGFDLRTHFLNVSNSKLCKVDTNQSLEDELWTTFFLNPI